MKRLKTLILFTMVIAAGISTAHPQAKAGEQLVESNLVEFRPGFFRCPAPSEVKCKAFAESVGPWKQNGGYRESVNTAFAPNAQCANVIKLNQSSNRLMCCYKECGALYMDVNFQSCTKTSPSDFHCQ